MNGEEANRGKHRRGLGLRGLSLAYPLGLGRHHSFVHPDAGLAPGLLKPLGHPPVTGIKYFAAVTIEEYRKDEEWLSQASDCVVRYWRTMNKKRKGL